MGKPLTNASHGFKCLISCFSVKPEVAFQKKLLSLFSLLNLEALQEVFGKSVCVCPAYPRDMIQTRQCLS